MKITTTKTTIGMMDGYEFSREDGKTCYVWKTYIGVTANVEVWMLSMKCRYDRGEQIQKKTFNLIRKLAKMILSDTEEKPLKSYLIYDYEKSEGAGYRLELTGENHYLIENTTRHSALKVRRLMIHEGYSNDDIEVTKNGEE